MSNKEIKVGDIVRYIGKEHDDDPEVNPPVGTLGKVLQETNTPDSVLYFIQWEKGSTSDDDCWYQSSEKVELAENIVVGKQGKGEIITINNTDMPNEAIWEFLKPKMEKNGLKPTGSAVVFCGDSPLFKTLPKYSKDDVHNAIALAYRSGYFRAMKGRPFKIGEKKEKKQGGRWVPVDPDNLPKEGMKVRYSRESKEYSIEKEPMIAIGDIGEFSYGKTLGLPGIRFNDGRFWNWVSFNNEPECLDMWVEDDE